MPLVSGSAPAPTPVPKPPAPPDVEGQPGPDCWSIKVHVAGNSSLALADKKQLAANFGAQLGLGQNEHSRCVLLGTADVSLGSRPKCSFKSKVNATYHFAGPQCWITPQRIVDVMQGGNFPLAFDTSATRPSDVCSYTWEAPTGGGGGLLPQPQPAPGPGIGATSAPTLAPSSGSHGHTSTVPPTSAGSQQSGGPGSSTSTSTSTSTSSPTPSPSSTVADLPVSDHPSAEPGGGTLAPTSAPAGVSHGGGGGTSSPSSSASASPDQGGEGVPSTPTLAPSTHTDESTPLPTRVSTEQVSLPTFLFVLYKYASSISVTNVFAYH